MKSKMAQQLKEILAQTTQEEFDREWAEIEKMDYQGPSADLVLEFFTTTLQTTVEYELASPDLTVISFDGTQFLTAA